MKVSAIITLLCLLCLAGCRSLPSSGEDPDSIASCMARMESAMNALFRDIQQPALKDRNLDSIRTLMRYQERAAGFRPSFSEDASAKVSRIRLRRYRARSMESMQILTDMLESLEQGNLQRAHALLLILDQHRRDCHVEFG